MSTIKQSSTGTTYTYRAPSTTQRAAGRGYQQVEANTHTGGLWAASDKPAYLKG